MKYAVSFGRDITLPLFIGASIYVGYRGLNLYEIPWIAETSMVYLLHAIQQALQSLYQAPYWVRYNLPDALWAYALISSLQQVWEGPWTRTKGLWLGIGFCLLVGSEISQGASLLPGTFDPFDLIGQLLGGLFALTPFPFLQKNTLYIFPLTFNKYL